MNMRTVIIATVLTCVRLSLVCGADGELVKKSDAFVEKSRILYGEPADPLDFKFLVQVQRNKQHICGGAIIARKWVLTATHCIYSANCVNVQIVPATMLDPKIKPDIIGIECHTHEQFLANKVSYDIALIKVDKDMLQYEGMTEVIPLPPAGKVFENGKIGTMLGWGLTENKVPSKELLMATAPVIDYETCSQSWKNWLDPKCKVEGATCNARGLPPKTICVQGDKDAPAGFCFGDSGGPLTVENMIAGVATVVIISPDKRCAIGAPSAFTATTDHLTWIHGYIDPDEDGSDTSVQPEIDA